MGEEGEEEEEGSEGCETREKRDKKEKALPPLWKRHPRRNEHLKAGAPLRKDRRGISTHVGYIPGARRHVCII